MASELNVVAKARIMPEGVDTDLDGIKKKVSDIVGRFGKVHSIEIKPIAFGLNCIEATILLSDSKGGLEEIESKVAKISGVSDFSVLDVNRI